MRKIPKSIKIIAIIFFLYVIYSLYAYIMHIGAYSFMIGVFAEINHEYYHSNCINIKQLISNVDFTNFSIPPIVILSMDPVMMQLNKFAALTITQIADNDEVLDVKFTRYYLPFPSFLNSEVKFIYDLKKNRLIQIF